MRKYYLFFFILIASGCKTLKEADLISPVSNPVSLSLRPAFDIDNLYLVYSYGSQGMAEKETGSVISKDVLFKDLQIKNKPIVEDVIKLFKSEIENNFNDNVRNETIGTIQLELNKYVLKRNGFQGFIVSYTWLFIFGVPVTPLETTLELQVTVFNNKGQLVKSYSGKGTGTVYTGMYWGYGSDGWRKSNSIAFKNAMSHIKKEMINDYNYLEKNLISN